MNGGEEDGKVTSKVRELDKHQEAVEQITSWKGLDLGRPVGGGKKKWTISNGSDDPGDLQVPRHKPPQWVGAARQTSLRAARTVRPHKPPTAANIESSHLTGMRTLLTLPKFRR